MLVFAVLVVAHVATAHMGLAVHQIGGTASLIWIPAGIALAAVLLYGPWVLVALAVGSFLTGVSTGRGLAGGVVHATANVVETGLAFYLLHHVLRIRLALDHVRDVLCLVVVVLCASLFASMVAGAGVMVVQLRTLEEMPALWATWWWGHFVAQLVITPLILTWTQRHSMLHLDPPPSTVEKVVIVVLLALVAGLAVTRQLSGTIGVHAPYYLVPILLWTGARFGPFGSALAAVYVNTLLILSAAVGIEPARELSELMSLVTVASITGLVLGGLMLERVRAVRLKAEILEGALDAIVTLDKHDHVLEFNPAAEKLFGYRAEDILGSELAPLIVMPELRGAYHELIKDKFEHWVPPGRRMRTLAIRADGSAFPVEVAITRTEVGDDFHLTGFIRDITAEQEAESSRRHSRELLERSVDRRTAELLSTNAELERREGVMRQAEALAHLGSFELDLETSTLKWSDELYRIHGVTPETFTPRVDNFHAFVHPDDQSAISAAVTKAMREGRSFMFETRIRRPDGELRNLQAQGEVFVDVHGHAVRITGCSQDITDRKIAEAARERLVELVESSDDAIIGLTLEGVVESWNPGAARIFGYTADEILGHTYTELVPDAQAIEVAATLQKVVAGEHLTHSEMVHKRRDGSQFDASVTVSGISDPSGRLIGISKVLRDVTDKKRAEVELRASLHEKEVLLREIHHRVKNNLQVISSLLNLQLANEPSEAGRRGLIESQNRVQSMALVHQLLYQSKDLSHIDIGEYLRGLATRLMSTYQIGAERVAINVDAESIQLDIDRAIPCGLIVNELVMNSIQHAFPDNRRGTIWLGVARHGDLIEVRVRDDGIGLPPDVELHRTRTFGLQISSTLSHQLGGTIELSGEGGTTATLTFPVTVHTEPA